MKNRYIIASIILLIIGLQFISFTTKTPEQIIEERTLSFHQGMETFEQSIATFKEKLVRLDASEFSVEELRKAHINNRLAFKSIEYLLNYIDPSAVKQMLNGAPLPVVEQNVPEVVVIEPSGLQVLDELVFGDEPHLEKATLLELTDKLEKDYNKIKQYQFTVKLTHRMLFEAVRQELLRIFTLGVTGFDTPGSANAIPEAAEAMKSIRATMIAYHSLLAEKDGNMAREMKQLFDEAIDYLEQENDFDNFDRLHFLKTYINPLYAITYQLHRKLGIETVDELNYIEPPFNYHATQLFDTKLLNAGVYANIDLKSPLNEKRKALGQLLFFDPILSSNNKRSCTSCHHPEKAFTDGLPKSLATNGEGTIQRNAPTVINSVFAEKYFYDGRAETLEKQTKHVIFHKQEFATDLTAIMNKLNQSEAYKKMFLEAYADMGKYAMTPLNVTNAISVYIASLSSFNSPFDQYVRGEIADIDPAVKRGFNLFMGKAACGTCHFAPTFNGTVPPLYEESETELLGIPTRPDTANLELDPDLGRYASGYPRDRAEFYKYSFKTVTVRNAALTAPYMHNGVYNTLEEVVDFYNRGGGAGMGLDLEYQTLPFDNLSLSKQEQADLVAFMKALTDNPFANDAPKALPTFEGNTEWNKRKIGGEY